MSGKSSEFESSKIEVHVAQLLSAARRKLFVTTRRAWIGLDWIGLEPDVLEHIACMSP